MSQYVFDPLGNNPDNQVSDSVTCPTPDGVNNAYFIPDASPFYAESLTIYDKVAQNFLTQGVDFLFIYEYSEATEAIGKTIVGGFAFTDPNRTGTYDYIIQTVGGDVVIAANTALADGLDTLASLQSYTWEDIADLPTEFPLVEHNHGLDSIDGINAIVTKLGVLVETISAKSTSISMSDIVDFDQTYVTPLMNALSGIGAAVANLKQIQSVPFLTVNNGLEPLTLLPADVTLGSWIDVGLSLTVPTTGYYMVDAIPYHEVTWDNPINPGKVYFRWVYNDSPVSGSNIMRIPKALTQGGVVKLQVRVTDYQISTLALSNTNGACILNLLKLTGS